MTDALVNDIRAGVTPVQHAVLDLIDARAETWNAVYGCDIEHKLRVAHARAKNALMTASLTNKRDYAMEAAARLIDVADEIERLLGARPCT